MTSKVTLHQDGNVAVITLDDGKANTLDPATFTHLMQALDEVESGAAGALLIMGRAGVFCAGLDLKAMPALGPLGLPALVEQFGRAMVRVFGFGKPVVAAVSGHAMGGGAMLALASDVRMMAQGPHRFALNEVHIGMTVPTFACEIVRATVAPQHHAHVVLHGSTLGPDELLARGMVDAVVAPEQLKDAAMARAQALSLLGPSAYANTKKLMRGAAVERCLAVVAGEAHWLVKPFLGG